MHFFSDDAHHVVLVSALIFAPSSFILLWWIVVNRDVIRDRENISFTSVDEKQFQYRLLTKYVLPFPVYKLDESCCSDFTAMPASGAGPNKGKVQLLAGIGNVGLVMPNPNCNNYLFV